MYVSVHNAHLKMYIIRYILDVSVSKFWEEAAKIAKSLKMAGVEQSRSLGGDRSNRNTAGEKRPKTTQRRHENVSST